MAMSQKTRFCWNMKNIASNEEKNLVQNACNYDLCIPVHTRYTYAKAFKCFDEELARDDSLVALKWSQNPKFGEDNVDGDDEKFHDLDDNMKAKQGGGDNDVEKGADEKKAVDD